MRYGSLIDGTVLNHLMRKIRHTSQYRTKKFLSPATHHFITRAIFALSIFVVAFLYFPGTLHAQELELSAGYAHSTGDFGLDGFQANGAWFFTQRVALTGNYDSMWDTSRIGAFELTTVGAISAKNHLQNFLVGPRIFMNSQLIKKHPIIPFGEAQFGLSHLNSQIQEGTFAPLSAADTSFTWLLGAGADYSLSPHWASRVQVGLLRTHLNDQGQSRLRIGIGIAYTFGERH